ncbi:MAG: DUF3017 domain-containing protein [Propionibacteriaceae bacterium]|nr:DUF3017 domain-containing protein [Propionibacteriaceae bacterium]
MTTPLKDRPGLIGQCRRQWPWVACVVWLAAGLVLAAVGRWRVGGFTIGGAALAAGLLRLFLPDPGILAIRGKAFDAVLYLGLGVLIVVVAAVVPGDPVA